MVLKELYPICKLGNSFLIILKENLPKVGKQLGIMSVQIDLSKSEITPPVDLEKHLKFNPWEEITDLKERDEVIGKIQNHFDRISINEQIINPLLGILEKVYISGLLSQNQDFYSGFKSLLLNNDIDLIELQGTKDIWCRDFMPVRSVTGTNLLFQYNPSYLKGKWEHKRTPRESIIGVLRDLDIEFTPIDDIKLDGGNVVQYENKVIMTDAIFIENEFKKDKASQSELVKRLEDYFQSSVIIIPHQPNDTLMHSDGVVRFLDDKTVLVNKFCTVNNPKFKESKHYMDNLFGALGKSGLDIIQVPYDPIDKIGEDEMLAALGIYINYLETKNHVFLPQFGEGFEEKDYEALKVFSELFKRVNKTVIPIYSRPIALKAGVLNCITWN